jgi:2-aminoadipate transaminase
MDWTERFAQRARNRGGAELAAILSGPGPGVLAMTGGFPNVATFQTSILGEIAARVIASDPGVALQYGPSAGLPSVREYLRSRVASTQGVEPAEDELIVTSGGMECIDLLCRTLLEPGDGVAIEAPTYLGAILGFAGYEAQLTGIPMDEEGMLVDELVALFEGGYRPKFVYVIPEYQNPSGRTLSLARRQALVAACRAFGVLIFEDVAYRDLSYDGSTLPSLWSLAPDVVLQAGTFSKVFCPGFRLGWAAGPPELIAKLAIAKQNTDQCAGALGQRMVEEYGRGGHFDRGIPKARALYASHWAATERALREHMPEGVRWSEPTGGMFTWLEVPEGLDTLALRDDAIDAGVAYVPGEAFYPAVGGDREMRLSFSSLGEDDLGEAVRRLAGVIAQATRTRSARNRSSAATSSGGANR